MAAENSSLDDQPIVLGGYLLKFTNIVKGYQYRWFVINNSLATLDYFEKETHSLIVKPRGCISLIFADVCPSVEDSLTFIVSSKTGNYFKLKAQSTKERQEWMNAVRSAILYFNTNLQNGRFYIDTNGGFFRRRSNNSIINSDQFQSLSSLYISSRSESNLATDNAIFYNDDATFRETIEPIDFISEPFKNICTLTAQMDDVHSIIVKNINSLPNSISAPGLTAFDKNLLVIKATCAATIECLKNCETLLRYRKFYHSRRNNRHVELASRNNLAESKNANGSVKSLPGYGTAESKLNEKVIIDSVTLVPAKSNDELNKSMKLDVVTNKFPSADNLSSNILLPIEGMDTALINPIDLTDAVECSSCVDKISPDGDIDCFTENKSLLQHLISQVKLGMDLTKVTLPTFILEKRSLLEMFSDYLAHPDLFIRISDEKTAENRMRAVFYWYVTSFHAGRKSAAAKKPYNPIIGETFHCMWHVSDNSRSDNGDTKCHHVHYTAEQVCHHPPITAFYISCPSKNIRLNASIHTKSKFQGMSIVAQMEGKVIIYLDEYDEEYHFTLPNAYAKNILSIPKLELSDKVTITCPKTKFLSSFVFHSKTLFGQSSINKISGEIKDPDNNVLVQLTGDWSSKLEIKDVKSNQVSFINLSDLVLYKKFVNPHVHQRINESQKLWHAVTEALTAGDLDKATKYKAELENRQRQSESIRHSKKQPFPVKYFQANLDGRWIFRDEISHQTKECC